MAGTRAGPATPGPGLPSHLPAVSRTWTLPCLWFLSSHTQLTSSIHFLPLLCLAGSSAEARIHPKTEPVLQSQRLVSKEGWRAGWRQNKGEKQSFHFLKWLLCFPFIQLSPGQVPEASRIPQLQEWAGSSRQEPGLPPAQLSSLWAGKGPRCS